MHGNLLWWLMPWNVMQRCKSALIMGCDVVLQVLYQDAGQVCLYSTAWCEISRLLVGASTAHVVSS